MLTPEQREALHRAINLLGWTNGSNCEHTGALQSLRDRLDAAEPWGYVADTEWLPGDAWGMTVVKQPTNYRSVPVFLAPPTPAAQQGMSEAPIGELFDGDGNKLDVPIKFVQMTYEKITSAPAISEAALREALPPPVSQTYVVTIDVLADALRKLGIKVTP